MIIPEQSQLHHPPRILMFSQRNIYEQTVWRSSFREFERIIQEIDSVDLVAPGPAPWYRNGKRLALRLGEKFRTPINPGIPRVKLTRDYDIFFAVVEKASELLNLKAVEAWKDHCKKSFCWVTEFYVKDIPTTKSCLEMLSRFDHVLFMANTIEPFQKILGNKCSYLPGGIDTLLFCPYPKPPKRSIDVLSIGRRSENTHQALLKLVERGELFYIYDTIDGLNAYNVEEHRLLVANLTKRSRYFIVNPGKVNKPEETGGQSEFGCRYFEGAAPGCILIGMRPQENTEFDKIFNWKDAVIDVPFGSDEIGTVIKHLDKQPDRQISIRRNNITQCLLHHDWVHRWQSVLSLAGLDPLPALLKRRQKLEQLADYVQAEIMEPQESRQR